MASSAREQLWTAPRVAKERVILFEVIYRKRLGRVLAAYNLQGGFLGRKARGFGPNQVPKIGGLKQSNFGSSEKTYFVVYIRFVVNRVAFYVPLLEEPHPPASPP